MGEKGIISHTEIAGILPKEDGLLKVKQILRLLFSQAVFIALALILQIGFFLSAGSRIMSDESFRTINLALRALSVPMATAQQQVSQQRNTQTAQTSFFTTKTTEVLKLMQVLKFPKDSGTTSSVATMMLKISSTRATQAPTKLSVTSSSTSSHMISSVKKTLNLLILS